MAVIVNSLKLHTSVLAGVEGNLSELQEFLTALENNKKNYPDNTRFQYLFNYDAGERSIPHWSTADIRIINGELEFYLLDGTKRLPGFAAQIALIEKICPNAKVRSTELGIQVDDESCAYFALSHAMSLTKIPDLHQQLCSLPEIKPSANFTSMFTYDESVLLCKKYESEASINPYSSLQSNLNLLVLELHQNYSVLATSSVITENKLLSALITALHKLIPISREMLPKKLGSLFKNTQRMSFDPAGYERSNEEPLDVYFSKHKKTHMIKGVSTERNAINDKSNKIKSETQVFLQDKTDQQIDIIIANRKKGTPLSCNNEEKQSHKLLSRDEELSVLDAELISFISALRKLGDDSANKEIFNIEIVALTSIQTNLRLLNFNDQESVNMFKKQLSEFSISNTDADKLIGQTDKQYAKLFSSEKSSPKGQSSEKVIILSKKILDFIEKNSTLAISIHP